MAINPGGLAGSVIPQEREIARALLSNQNVAVGQHEQPPWVDETGHKRRRGEARRHLRRLSAVWHGQRPVGDNRTGLGSRQLGRINAKPPPYLVLSQKILVEFVLNGRLLAHHLLLRARKGKPEPRSNESHGYEKAGFRFS